MDESSASESDESSDESSEGDESDDKSNESDESSESESEENQAPAGWKRVPSRSAPSGFSYRQQSTGTTYSTLPTWAWERPPVAEDSDSEQSVSEESVSLAKEGGSLGNSLEKSNGERNSVEINAEINAGINGLGRARKDRGEKDIGRVGSRGKMQQNGKRRRHKHKWMQALVR
jgi:hypothetical protein